jgi:putative ABC transport system permease protein
LLLEILTALAPSFAATGIYGVASYLVAAGRKEIGIRVAMGAEPGDVLRLILEFGASAVERFSRTAAD